MRLKTSQRVFKAFDVLHLVNKQIVGTAFFQVLFNVGAELFVRVDEGKLFQLFVYAHGVAMGHRAFYVFLYLSQDAAFTHTSLARKYLYNVFVDEWSYALGIIVTVNKFYHTA